MVGNKDIFKWAWEQRQKKIPPDEPRFTMAEVIDVLQCYSDPDASEKKIRDYEEDKVIDPARTSGGHRLFSVSNVLCLHLMMQGTKYLGSKKNTKPIVKLYEISRRQPKHHDPTVFDYDPKLPGENKIHKLLHEPLLRNPIRQVAQLVKVVMRIDRFLHLNDFARKHGIGFKCRDEELINVIEDGKNKKIAPPLTEWESVRKALNWNEYYYAAARVKGKLPKKTKDRDKFDAEVNRKIIAWLVKKGYAVKLRRR